MAKEVQDDVHRAHCSAPQLFRKTSPENFKAFWRNALRLLHVGVKQPNVKNGLSQTEAITTYDMY